MNRFGKIALKTILWIIGSVIFLLLLIIFLIRIPAVQNFVVGKVTNYVEGKIGTPVNIGYINITFPKKLVLEDVYFEDQSQDTLLAGEKLLVDINMWKLLSNTVEIKELELKGLTAKINRTLPDSTFNFDYIVKAFVSEEQKPKEEESESTMKFDLDKVLFERIRFVYSDEVIGTSADINLNHFNTRIKKFDLSGDMAFDLPVITIDGLNAVVKQWAVMQEGDAPSAEDFGVTTASTEESSLMPQLSTNTIDLRNIHIKYDDQSSGMDTRFDLKSLVAHIDHLDLNKEVVSLKELTLNASDSYVLFEKTTTPTVQTTAPVPESNEEETSSINWVVTANKLNIHKTNFWFKDENQPRTKGMDFFNLRLTDFEGDLQDLYYSSDSISGGLRNLTVKDHSGFFLKKLQADFVYHNTGALIENLHAETPKTLIRDYIKISYPSIDALSEDLNQVHIEANIRKSHIDMSDLRFFAPDLEQEEVMKPLMTQRFHIDGRVNGRVNDLYIPSFEFRTLDNTHVLAKARIKGLPDMDKLHIDLDLRKFTTGRRDIERLIAKSTLPDSIQLPNSISLSGTFNGGMTGFNSNLSLVTEQGNASVNGHMHMARDTTYDLQIAINDFNIGKILNQDSTLGIIAAEAQVKGTGLDPKTMVADIVGTINRFDAMGYSYNNISMDLNANAGDITGNITSPDPNIQFNMDLDANMHDQYPRLYAELMVDSINFQNLGFMDDNFRYHGKIVADFETLDIDYLNGSLHVINSHVAYNDERYILDSVSLSAFADSANNRIVFDSEFLRAHLVGDYKISELGASIQDIVRVYYNPTNNQDSVSYSPQRFEFSARLTHSRFLKELVPDLTEMRDITLDGTFDSEGKSLMAKLLAPRLNYMGTEVEDIGVDIITVDSTMYYNALISQIKTGGIELTNTVASGSIIENNIDFGLWIRDKENTPQYHLGAKASINEGTFLLSMLEDGLMLNYDKWNIDPSNQISFGDAGILVNGFTLTNNGQELAIQSQDSLPNSPIDLNFNNFRIETFTKIIDSEMLDFGGGIHGTATISRLESSPVFVSDLKINEFAFGGQNIGDVALKVNNEQENTFSADVSITGDGNDVQLIGDFISPPNGDAQIRATLELKPMMMKTLEAFSMGQLEDTEGQITGKLDISGTTAAPRINGGLTFNNSKMNVAMLNAVMSMNNQTISFNNQGLQFRQFEIKDARNNIARINGTIRTTDYTDFGFNLNLNMDDFEAMNSSMEDNDLFYGKMYLTSNLRITGDLNTPKIDGNIRANDNTDFFFVVPNENPGIAERDGVVKFVSRSDSSRTNVFAKLDSLTTVSTVLSGFDMALKLQTDPDARFTIVLDPGTKDELHIQGEAELTASIDASDKITLSGVYTVDQGEYTVPLGPLSRRFTFQKGSTITWAGDPLDARLNITAVYRNRFPTLELVQSQIGSQGQNLYKQRIPFNVLLNLRGDLFKPDLNFDIELDEGSAVVPQEVTNRVNIALSNMRNDPAELNKQVFSLIALGRFMSANPFESLSGGGGVEGMARSTVSSFLTSQLNNLASDLIKGVELDFNLQSEQDYLTGSAQTRTDLNVGISKALFDDRLKVTVGSNFEVEGNTRPGEKASNIAGDISLDYQLSPDGRYIARVYRKNQYQATLQGQFIETGIGFVINMSYDRFKELFMSSRALQNYYNTESRSFRRRFDVDRMEVDSAYRDSIRTVIRDSLMRNNPEYRNRIEEDRIKEQEQLNEQQDSTNNDQSRRNDEAIKREENTAIRNEEEERESNEK